MGSRIAPVGAAAILGEASPKGDHTPFVDGR
jgi:hypothetical protein